VQFAGISGNLTAQYGPYLGTSRLLLGWDSVSGWYKVNQPGIYNYFVSQRALAGTLRLSAAPVGTA
jgi:hypothetical protein